MLTRADVARDAYSADSTQATPRGFLPARLVGTLPNTEAYRAELDLLIGRVGADLEAYGLSPVVTLTPKQRAGASSLAKMYAAEDVLFRSETGTLKDPEGASYSLTGSDLSHWERMLRRATDDAERYLGPLEKPPPTSGVLFAPLVNGGDLSLYPDDSKTDWRNR